jgi:hypothetical protein
VNAPVILNVSKIYLSHDGRTRFLDATIKAEVLRCTGNVRVKGELTSIEPILQAQLLVVHELGTS